jgi:hypothetical protein
MLSELDNYDNRCASVAWRMRRSTLARDLYGGRHANRGKGLTFAARRPRGRHRISCTPYSLRFGAKRALHTLRLVANRRRSAVDRQSTTI